MSDYGKKNISESEYVANRMSSSRDDRCNDNKRSADAYLRGRLGVNRANNIINMIDNHKSRR